jgi:hypothetical protein
MSPAVTLPVFGSASNQAAAGQSGNSGEWDSGNADPMDFDLLAEYLLDDAGGNPVSFDFK